jgi:hypothetical protein
VVAPQGPLLGLVSVVAPLIVTGNTVRGDRQRAAPADRDHAGRGDGHLRRARRRGQHPHRPRAEIAPWLASHMDVNGLDLTGVDDPVLAKDLEDAAAENLKRVRRPR